MTTLYRFYGRDGRLLYVGIAEDWRQRFNTHSGGAPWFRDADVLTLTHYRDRASARAAEREAIRSEWPLWNLDQSPWRMCAKRMHDLNDPILTWLRGEYRALGDLHGAARASRLAKMDREFEERLAQERRLLRTKTETHA